MQAKAAIICALFAQLKMNLIHLHVLLVDFHSKQASVFDLLKEPCRV
jgi:phosphoribosylpyrophosphate synthetase